LVIEFHILFICFTGVDFLERFAELDTSFSDNKDYQFVEWLTRVKKLTAIPPSAFFSSADKHLGEKYIRFCFIKEDSNLQKAAAILQEWKKTMQ